MVWKAPSTPNPHPGYAGLLMRADNFFALGETQKRYQLIQGVVIRSPSPRPWHWSIVEEVLMQLRDHARRIGHPSGFETYAAIDVFIDDLAVYQPDLCAYSRPRPKDAAEPGRLQACSLHRGRSVSECRGQDQ